MDHFFANVIMTTLTTAYKFKWLKENQIRHIFGLSASRLTCFYYAISVASAVHLSIFGSLHVSLMSHKEKNISIWYQLDEQRSKNELHYFFLANCTTFCFVYFYLLDSFHNVSKTGLHRDYLLASSCYNLPWQYCPKVNRLKDVSTYKLSTEFVQAYYPQPIYAAVRGSFARMADAIGHIELKWKAVLALIAQLICNRYWGFN